MSAQVVRLKIRARLTDGSRPYLDPVFAANGKIKPSEALIDGQPTHVDSPTYYLRYLKTGKRVWESVGDDPQLALVTRRKREMMLEAQAAGVVLAEEEPTGGKKALLSDVVQEFMGEVAAHRSKKTLYAYSLAMRMFLESCTKTYLEEIDRKDILSYMTHLRAKGNGLRTVANRVSYLKHFILSQSITWPLRKDDRPRYTEKIVSAYSKQDIQAMLAVADQEESELIQFFLFTGVREKEAQFAAWPDVNFDTKTFTVREKLDLGFVPKDKEEGVIPIPDSLVEILRTRRARFPTSRLIFTTALGVPNGHMLRTIKRLGMRAGLNCGHCYSKRGLCCATNATCRRLDLHRLRKTFATMHHEADVSARTIQRWLRHSSLDTTLHYLAASDDNSERTRDQVNSTFAAFAPARCAQ
ncbi:MAG: site-specific integrase [Edaphobacter sp.]